tara:strand:+ start:273 stop:383 length:111 start_codon:yes stop_codon:yes gene_type:complete
MLIKIEIEIDTEKDAEELKQILDLIQTIQDKNDGDN